MSIADRQRDIKVAVGWGRCVRIVSFMHKGVDLLIPPLRERPQEIEPLAASFLSAACRDMERVPPLQISSAAMDRLRLHTWPGNIRELRNVIERAAVMCTDSTILPEHLPPSVLKAPG